MPQSLQQFIRLSHKVEVYVPSRDKDGHLLATDLIGRLQGEVADKLTELFGGATVTPAAGFYRHHDGRRALEDVRIVFAYASELSMDNVSECINLALYVKDTARQETILLTVDGEAYLI